MGTRDIPQADMIRVQKSSNAQRKEIFKFTPEIGLRCINYGDISTLDHFYLDTQNYRDYYRDAYNVIHKPKRFYGCLGSGGYKTDHALNAVSAPIHRVRERQPVVYLARDTAPFSMDGSIRIGAHFASNSSVNYKR